MSEHRSPTEELRYQTHLLEQHARLLDRVRKNSQISAVAAVVFMLLVAIQCLIVILYLAGAISLVKLLRGALLLL